MQTLLPRSLSEVPFLGVGVGLRPVHYPEVLARATRGELRVDWFEALTENYMVPGGRPPRVLNDVRSHTPIVLHGVSLNLGSVDPLNDAYLGELAELAKRIEPAWISDHLCWTGAVGTNLHDLLPLPYNGDVIRHVAARIRRVQDRLGRRIAIENVSSYLSYCDDELEEWEFLNAVAIEADCGILLDVNNVFVSAHNHGFDAIQYIDAMPAERVFQIHLAGHSRQGALLIDTHDHPVCDDVWALYAHTLRHVGAVSTLIEWDEKLPDFDRLEAEAQHAREIFDEITRKSETGAPSEVRHDAAR